MHLLVWKLVQFVDEYNNDQSWSYMGSINNPNTITCASQSPQAMLMLHNRCVSIWVPIKNQPHFTEKFKWSWSTGCFFLIYEMIVWFNLVKYFSIFTCFHPYPSYNATLYYSEIVMESENWIAATREYLGQFTFYVFIYVSIIIMWNLVGSLCWLLLHRWVELICLNWTILLFIYLSIN